MSTTRQRWRGRTRLVAVVAAAATALVAASLAASASSGTKADPVTVRVVLGPYLDLMPWNVAHAKGFDKAQGIDLHLTLNTVQSNVAATIRRGDADIGWSCTACIVPLLKKVPDLRDFMITDLFKGFVVVGRNGSLTYNSLVKKEGADKAKKDVVASFKGKTFVLVGALFQSLLESSLAQAGLTLKDVKVLNFADEAKGALAYIRGSGDYYLGGLPTTNKLLTDPCCRGKFVEVGAQPILGPGGLWYSSMFTTKQWLAANQETALKLMAVWYHTMKFMRDKPEEAFPILRATLNKAAATNFTPAQVRFAGTVRILFQTLAEAKSIEFDPKVSTYYGLGVKHYAVPSTLPAGTSPYTYFVYGPWFRMFNARTDLVRYANANS
jgi:ABC-type nitrate/sulfonate/bicarbonate transport system substrate-binding protein